MRMGGGDGVLELGDPLGLRRQTTHEFEQRRSAAEQDLAVVKDQIVGLVDLENGGCGLEHVIGAKGTVHGRNGHGRVAASAKPVDGP